MAYVTDLYLQIKHVCPSLRWQRNFGGLRIIALQVIEVSQQDDLVDADGDGTADVLQVS